MPPRMTTRSAGRATAAPRGGRTSGRNGRGGGRTRGRSGDQGNGRINGPGGQVGGQGRSAAYYPENKRIEKIHLRPWSTKPGICAANRAVNISEAVQKTGTLIDELLGKVTEEEP
ncbi:hypothetical protein Tco_1183473 [Tanacetum coccineum]